MKKSLSAVLVLAMVLGLGVCASAVSLAAPIKADSVNEIYDSSLYFALMWTGKAYGRADRLCGIESAYKAGKTKDALWDAFLEISERMDRSAENKAINNFWNDAAAVEKAYKDGTLAIKSALLFADCLDAFEEEYDKLAMEYLKPVALAYADASLEVDIWLYSGVYLEACGDLTSEKRYELGDKLGTLIYEYIDQSSMLEQWEKEGNWAELTAFSQDLLQDVKAIYAEYGITKLPARPTWPDKPDKPDAPNPDPQLNMIARIWQAIVKYVLFGWLIALFR